MHCGRIRDETSGLFAVAHCTPEAGAGWLRFVLSSLAARLGSRLDAELGNLELSGRLPSAAVRDYEVSVLRGALANLRDWLDRSGSLGGFAAAKFFPDRDGFVRGYVVNVGAGAAYALESGRELVPVAAPSSDDSEIATLRLGPGDRLVLAAAPLAARFTADRLARLLWQGAHGDNASEALLWQALDRQNGHYRHASVVWTCPSGVNSDGLKRSALEGRLREIEDILLKKPATLERLKMEMEVAQLRYWLAHHSAAGSEAGPGNFISSWAARRAAAAKVRHGEEYWQKKCAHDLFRRQSEELQWDDRRRALCQKVTDIVKISKK